MINYMHLIVVFIALIVIKEKYYTSEINKQRLNCNKRIVY